MDGVGDVVELRAGDARVTVDVSAGGRLGQIEVGGQPLLWASPAAPSIGWGSYPMAPWVGPMKSVKGKSAHIHSCVAKIQ